MKTVTKKQVETREGGKKKVMFPGGEEEGMCLWL